MRRQRGSATAKPGRSEVTPEQVEGTADAIAEAMQNDLATKADLAKGVVGVIGFQTMVLLGAALTLARAFSR